MRQGCCVEEQQRVVPREAQTGLGHAVGVEQRSASAWGQQRIDGAGPLYADVLEGGAHEEMHRVGHGRLAERADASRAGNVSDAAEQSVGAPARAQLCHRAPRSRIAQTAEIALHAELDLAGDEESVGGKRGQQLEAGAAVGELARADRVLDLAEQQLEALGVRVAKRVEVNAVLA